MIIYAIILYLILKSKNEKKTSFVLEFKYLKEAKKDLEKALDDLSNNAIQQIKDNKYDYGLKVIYISLAHHGKDVSIKWEERKNDGDLSIIIFYFVLKKKQKHTMILVML